MYRFFLSLRYIRVRPINWIGTLSIFVAVGALILIMAIMSGFLEKSREHLRGHLSDLVISPSFDIPLRSTGGFPERDAEPALEAIRNHPSVQAAAAQMVWYGMVVPPRAGAVLSDPDGMSMLMVNFVGVNIPDEYGATALLEDLNKEIENGDADQRPDNVEDPFAMPANVVLDEDERPRDRILMGERLAARWGLRKGDRLELATATVDTQTGSFGQSANRTVILAGTYRSSFNEMDLKRIYMERAALGDWLGKHGEYTQISVKLKDYERDHVQVTADLRKELSVRNVLHAQPEGIARNDFGWELKTWENSRQTMLAAIENERALLGIMLGLVLLVAGFGVFAILSMMVSEKRRDIGILAALGATPKGILSLFLSIGGIEALVGTVMGVIAGVVSAYNINAFEQWLSRTFGFEIFNREVYYFDHIPTVIEWPSIIMIAVAAVSTALIAAAVPALRAAYLNPVDALRYE